MCLLFSFQRRLHRRPVSQFGVRAWESIWRETPHKPHNSHRRNYSFQILWKLVLYGADCVSINLYTRADGNGNYKCELNNATHEGHEGKLIDQEMYSYHAGKYYFQFKIQIGIFCFSFKNA